MAYEGNYTMDDLDEIIVDGIGTAGVTIIDWISLLILIAILSVLSVSAVKLMKVFKK